MDWSGAQHLFPALDIVQGFQRCHLDALADNLKTGKRETGEWDQPAPVEEEHEWEWAVCLLALVADCTSCYQQPVQIRSTFPKEPAAILRVPRVLETAIGPNVWHLLSASPETNSWLWGLFTSRQKILLIWIIRTQHFPEALSMTAATLVLKSWLKQWRALWLTSRYHQLCSCNAAFIFLIYPSDKEIFTFLHFGKERAKSTRFIAWLIKQRKSHWFPCYFAFVLMCKNQKLIDFFQNCGGRKNGLTDHLTENTHAWMHGLPYYCQYLLETRWEYIKTTTSWNRKKGLRLDSIWYTVFRLGC